jgi:hypothetical protein
MLQEDYSKNHINIELIGCYFRETSFENAAVIIGITKYVVAILGIYSLTSILKPKIRVGTSIRILITNQTIPRNKPELKSTGRSFLKYFNERTTVTSTNITDIRDLNKTGLLDFKGKIKNESIKGMSQSKKPKSITFLSNLIILLLCRLDVMSIYLSFYY